MKLEVIIEKGRARLVNPVYLKSDAPHRFAIEIGCGSFAFSI